MTGNVFTYGSLMYPVVWNRVVQGRYPGQPAVIEGFVRRLVRGQVYPGLVAGSPESVVSGVVYLDVSDADLASLDRFEGEGDAYLRTAVEVALADGTRVGAWAYCYGYPDRVTEEDWDREAFEAHGLEHFLATYCRDREV